MYPIPPSVLPMADSFLHFFDNRNLILQRPFEYSQVAHQLYKSLMPFFIPANIDALIIVPDAVLNTLPFDALLTDKANTSEIAAMPFAVKKYNISYGYSSATLLEQQAIKKEKSSTQVVGLAPVFANKERGLGHLPASIAELKAIRERFPNGNYYLHREAGFNAFQKSTGAQIIHLSTHANAGNDSIPASLELADSTLQIFSIYNLSFKSRLAVISGCETGKGKLATGEGLMSIARAFSYAGTRNTIASLWNTSDITASSIFTNFYGNINTMPFSKSLQQAKINYLENSSVQGASPYYWANLIHIGQPKDALAKSNKIGKWMVGSLLMLIIFIMILPSWKKKSIY
jgi:CHAT domain-containing protein